MRLRLCVFDFDCTLSTLHVFHALSSGDGLVPPPHARSEQGQLARIGELDESPEFSQYGGFASVVFGGPERVAELQAFFQELRAAGVESIVLSRGLVGPIRKCLEQVGLLRYFTDVYANIGISYGETDYDKALPPMRAARDAHYLGAAGNAGWGSKGKMVMRCLQERGLSAEEAIFVDDTASEIANVRGACYVLHVQPARGMGAQDLAQIRGMLGPPDVAGVPAQRRLAEPSGAAPGPLASSASCASCDGPAPSELPSPKQRAYDNGGPSGRSGLAGVREVLDGEVIPAHEDGHFGGGQSDRRSQRNQMQEAIEEEEWWGSAAPPPPPPPPRRRSYNDSQQASPSAKSGAPAEDLGALARIGLLGNLVGVGGGGGGGAAAHDAASSEFGPAPPIVPIKSARGLVSGRGEPQPTSARPSTSTVARPPSNLYSSAFGRGEIPTPLCFWSPVDKDGGGIGAKELPTCTCM